MSKVGYKWQLKIAAAGDTPVYQTVGKASDVDLKLDGTSIDTSTRDLNGWMGKEQGLKSWSSSVKHLWVPTDAALVILRAAYFDGTKVLCKFRDSSSDLFGFNGTAIIKSIGVPQAINGKVELTIELDGDGALEYFED